MTATESVADSMFPPALASHVEARYTVVHHRWGVLRWIPWSGGGHLAPSSTKHGSIFPTRDAANAAVAVTLRYAAQNGFDWSAHDYTAVRLSDPTPI